MNARIAQIKVTAQRAVETGVISAEDAAGMLKTGRVSAAAYTAAHAATHAASIFELSAKVAGLQLEPKVVADRKDAAAALWGVVQSAYSKQGLPPPDATAFARVLERAVKRMAGTLTASRELNAAGGVAKQPIAPAQPAGGEAAQIEAPPFKLPRPVMANPPPDVASRLAAVEAIELEGALAGGNATSLNWAVDTLRAQGTTNDEVKSRARAGLERLLAPGREMLGKASPDTVTRLDALLTDPTVTELTPLQGGGLLEKYNFAGLLAQAPERLPHQQVYAAGNVGLANAHAIAHSVGDAQYAQEAYHHALRIRSMPTMDDAIRMAQLEGRDGRVVRLSLLQLAEALCEGGHKNGNGMAVPARALADIKGEYAPLARRILVDLADHVIANPSPYTLVVINALASTGNAGRVTDPEIVSRILKLADPALKAGVPHAAFIEAVLATGRNDVLLHYAATATNSKAAGLLTGAAFAPVGAGWRDAWGGEDDRLTAGLRKSGHDEADIRLLRDELQARTRLGEPPRPPGERRIAPPSASPHVTAMVDAVERRDRSAILVAVDRLIAERNVAEARSGLLYAAILSDISRQP